MKWVTSTDLNRWAETVLSRSSLSELVSSLIRASCPSPKSFRFPTGDSAQLPGYDGSLESEGTFSFIPEGKSVWEFSTETKVEGKAQEDYEARTKKPRGMKPAETTFIFVTPREWAGADKWSEEKREEKTWKGVQVIDGVDLEEWLGLNPAVAARFARGKLSLMPNHGVKSTDEFWDEYVSRFEPLLGEAVLLAGRADQATFLLQQLQGVTQPYLWQADSLEEVIAFAVAAIRTGDTETRKYVEARALVVETKDAALQLANRTDLVFLLRGTALSASGFLGKRAPTIVPTGRDQTRSREANVLRRPQFHELAASLKTMGLADSRAEQLARACGRSVTILERRIPSANGTPPTWSSDKRLVPALLAGGWSTGSQQDLDAVHALTDESTYAAFEKCLLPYLRKEDSPIDREGDVWQMRAPVDAFVHLGSLISRDDLQKFEEVVTRVFSEIDPSLDLPSDERFYAGLRGKKFKHSEWLRKGLATTLLLIAEFHDEAGVHIWGTTPQSFVNRIVSNIPGLDSDYRAIASLYAVLPIIAEAAPRPLLEALDRLIEGDGRKIRPLFQDKEADLFHSSSPHTALLWALEVLAWDPSYLADATLTIAKLARVDPGGKLANRPITSLREIFVVWHPSTNANLEQRLAALDQIIRREPSIAWELVIKLLPEFHGIASPTAKPRYREAGASEAEAVTYGIVGRAYKQIVDRVLALVGNDSARWITVIHQISSFSPPDRTRATQLLEAFAKNKGHADLTDVWSALRSEINRHRRFQSAEWAMKDDDLGRLEAIEISLQPADLNSQVAWLFNSYNPDLPEAGQLDQWERLRTRRRDAVMHLFKTNGMASVLDLSSNVKLPAHVGYAFVDGVDLEQIEKMMEMALRKREEPDQFAIALSAAANFRFKVEWESRIKSRLSKGLWSEQQVGVLLLDWSNEPATWHFVEELGPEIEQVYWSRKASLPVRAEVADDLELMVRKYLAFGRALAALDSVSYSAAMLSSDTLCRVLDSSIREINETPNVASNNLAYEVESIFTVLRSREEIPKIEIAKREYAYLPLLDFHQSHLTIHSLLVQDADLFVSLLSDIFKPASGEEREITEERRARASAGYRLLSECRTIPGLKNGDVDAEELNSWIKKVRELAAAHDRAAIADEYVGHILAYAPADADGAWPHRAVRDVIESLSSPAVERGIRIERFNMRGVTTRGPFEGGAQERSLAATVRGWSKATTKWLRTSRLLEEIAQEWEHHAEQEDLRARQDELRYS